jgi:hypothetical protein
VNQSQRVLVVVALFVFLMALAWVIVPFGRPRLSFSGHGSSADCGSAIVTARRHQPALGALFGYEVHGHPYDWARQPSYVVASCIARAQNRVEVAAVIVALDLIGLVLGLLLLREPNRRPF